MANKVSSYTEMAASDVTTPASVAVHVLDMQSGSTTRWMDYEELQKSISWQVTTSLPAADADAGFYVVTTGANRGLYFCNGAARYEITLFNEDAVI